MKPNMLLRQTTALYSLIHGDVESLSKKLSCFDILVVLGACLKSALCFTSTEALHTSSGVSNLVKEWMDQ